ncbi:hypothetical protein [Bradyrhizobium cenepequi]|uniref:hypothetical protein n=1 Tax=Bradyrhizobium cenepequi TaxID=2821403 RepID=UPI001CE37DD5|nr:hypothetical protein [Bradyrhizobium cenepequi]MCA6108094.1 hypothetical protein [Bradyrhizobium cenepequi]
MPEISLKLVPGVNADFTPTLNQAAIASCDLIRFRDRLPQKLGGWSRFFPNPLPGIPRAVHGWSDLRGGNHLAVGTTLELAVITDGALQDITPQTLISPVAPNASATFSTTVGSSMVAVSDPSIANVTTDDAIFFNTPVSLGGVVLTGLHPITLASGGSTYNIDAGANATTAVTNGGVVPTFTTIVDSSRVTVNFPSHGLAIGDTFNFPIPTTDAVSGVTIDGVFAVIDVLNPNQFVITAPTQASAANTFSMNGGTVQLKYFITLGPPPPGAGFGIGPFGLGGFGTGVLPQAQRGTPISAADWSLDNFGEDILANPQGGPIYFWEPNTGFQTAELVATGPVFNNGIFVAMPEQILVAWGSTLSNGQQDLLLVRWSDSEDFTNWQVTAETQAGSFRIPTGSKVVAGYQGPQQSLIWTDIDVYAMQYLGPPFVFGFNKLSSGCGLIGPHAVTSLRGNTYWMSSGSFFVLSGNGVQDIPCTVWDVVFQDLDEANQEKCVAAANSQFDEVAFYYPSKSGGTGENDKYVKLNVTDGTWDYGNLGRSAWMDQSVIGQPIGASPGGVVFQHETSNDADGAPMISTFTTGYFVLSEAQDFPFVDWLFPDMKWGLFNGPQTASVQVIINVVTYPNSPVRTFGPFTMNAAQEFINLRLRGRQISFTFTSSDLGSFWRMGNPRVRAAKAGRR